MKPLPLSLFILSLLSGCALTDDIHFSEETKEAILQSEANLNQKLTNLELAISNQSDYIDSLESELQHLKNQIAKTEAAQPPLSDKKTPPGTPKHKSEKSPKTQVTLGSVEAVNVATLKQTFSARIDTGATTSSINALDIQEFEREGKKWVKFHIVSEKERTDDSLIEAPVVRYTSIRQSSSKKSIKRPVVELWLKLGKLHEKVPFSLADRSHMTYPVLLGRDFLKDIALVDVSGTYLYSNPDDKK
ncbi:ATP-dependent zinc protease [Vibrio sp. JC009]|uniref:ATP-dependent zinc protease family protein n=1 Tax=Vibrio sp. JC009 TaxID=2912314 RepID=UPI0023AFD1E7|nr:ATP-dependent zinc protease [Vibrio sp. JC009]WED22758.1 ATP-dependent zinc protease [Vibrio sp. JC009]